MEEDIMPLQEFIETVKGSSKMHICVQDLSGMVLLNGMYIERPSQIHSLPVCDCAKSTEKGFKLCLKCKHLATEKAKSRQKVFCGECPIGLSEIVYPVTVDSRVICIVYIGNLCFDEQRMTECIQKTAKITGVDTEPIIEEIQNTEKSGTYEYYMSKAKAVGSYIKMLYNLKRSASDERKHWIAEAFMKYADTYYYRNINISLLSKLYEVNEKYAGRIFKQQAGMSFSMYLNKLRIERAKCMLRESNENILEISLDCGYNNIAYFNRVFKQFSGMSPREYRRAKESE